MEAKDKVQTELEDGVELENEQLDDVSGGYGEKDICPKCGSKNVVTLLPSRKRKCQSCGNQF